MCDRAIFSSGCSARLVLNHGLDEQFAEHGVILDERGMRFLSRWEFPLGTQLALNCTCATHDGGGGVKQVRLEGIVVWSERTHRTGCGPSLYDTTLLFLELPDDLRASVREFSHHLAEAG